MARNGAQTCDKMLILRQKRPENGLQVKFGT